MSYLNAKSETQLICYRFEHTMSANISYDADKRFEMTNAIMLEKECMLAFTVDASKTRLWVNGERGCLFRACRMKSLTILELETNDPCADSAVEQIYCTTIFPRVAPDGTALLSHDNVVVYLARNAMAITSEHGRLFFVKSNAPIEYTTM